MQSYSSDAQVNAVRDEDELLADANMQMYILRRWPRRTIVFLVPLGRRTALS